MSLFVHVCLLLLMLLAQRELPEEKSLELPADLISKFLVSPPPEDILQETCLEWLDVAPSHVDLYGVEVELVNEGPVTMLLDSTRLF